MSIDNMDLIRPLLTFGSSDDYYFLQVVVRKKDRLSLPFKIGGSNNNSRLIKSYCVSSAEYLDDRYDEIKAISTLFNARAMICLNRRSYRSSSHQMMVRLAQSIQANNFNNKSMWDNVSGTYNPVNDKTWIIDIDQSDLVRKQTIINTIKNCEPDRRTNKVVLEIPSKSGVHLITKPFNLQEFSKIEPDIEVHKNNPTNLFIPL